MPDRIVLPLYRITKFDSSDSRGVNTFKLSPPSHTKCPRGLNIPKNLLCRLPPELFFMIWKLDSNHLHQDSTLSSLSLTCREIHAIVQPIQFKAISYVRYGYMREFPSRVFSALRGLSRSPHLHHGRLSIRPHHNPVLGHHTQTFNQPQVLDASMPRWEDWYTECFLHQRPALFSRTTLIGGSNP